MAPEDDDARAAAIAAQIQRLAAQLEEISDSSSARPPAFFEAIYRSRRARDEIFGTKHLFSEPAWDILLELAHAELCGTRIALHEVGQGAGLFPLVANRYIQVLEDLGVVERHARAIGDPEFFVGLTPEGRHKLRLYAEKVGGIYDYPKRESLVP